MTILVVGDANVDLTGILPRFPSEGDDSTITTLTWGSGGSAANVATALALLKTPTRLLTRIGSDSAGEIALRVAHAAGVDLSTVQHDQTLATGLCFAAISLSGERTLFSFRGANVALTVLDSTTMLQDIHWLHIAGHALLAGSQRTTTLTLLKEARQRNIPVSLDLCLPLLRERKTETLELLPHLHILFANEQELAVLLPNTTQTPTLTMVINQCRSLNNSTLFALKLGPRGCVVINEHQHHVAHAFPIEATDTNGCGDAFAAGFLCAYLHDKTLASCAMLANAMGALTATCPGSAEALPDLAKLQAFLSNAAPY